MYDKKSNKYIGYIYKIYNDINNKLYIGQTIQNPKYRFKQHSTWRNSNSENMLLPKAIDKYGVENFHIEILEKLSFDTNKDLKNALNKLEIDYIKNFNTTSPNGYNITKGGSFVGEINCTPIDQYSTNGEFIKSWNSISEAANGLGLHRASSITYVCIGKYKTAYGFVWRYKGEPFNKQYLSKPKHIRTNTCETKEIDLYDKYGNFIKSFNSALICAKYLNTERINVYHTCNGVSTNVKGYVTRYHGDSFDKYNTDGLVVPIDVYDINKQYICSFKDIDELEILDDMPNKIMQMRNKIRKCCNGVTTNYLGYIFRYQGDGIDKFGVNIKTPHGSSINQYDLDNNFIRSFNNANEAIEYYGNKGIIMKRPNINYCCNGEQETAHNFKWYYQHDLQNPDKSRIRTRLNQTNPKAIEYIKNQKLSQAS